MHKKKGRKEHDLGSWEGWTQSSKHPLTCPKFWESKTGSSQQPASAASSKEGNCINVTEKLTLPEEQIERPLAEPHRNSDNTHKIYFLPYVLWKNSQGKWERETLKLEKYVSPPFPPMAPVHASHFRKAFATGKAATATFLWSRQCTHGDCAFPGCSQG